MKKIISIILASVLVLSFAACAKQAENGNESGETTTAQGAASAADNEAAIIAVGSDEIESKAGTAVARGTQDGNDYTNDTLGIKITPPESFENFADEEEGEGVPSGNNDYFVIELTENHDGIVYKTVTVSITEGTAYADGNAYISYQSENAGDGYMQIKSIGTTEIGGREYTCVKHIYSDAPDTYHTEYVSVESGTLVILGFDQMPDSEIADFFNNYIEQY